MHLILSARSAHGMAAESLAEIGALELTEKSTLLRKDMEAATYEVKWQPLSCQTRTDDKARPSHDELRDGLRANASTFTPMGLALVQALATSLQQLEIEVTTVLHMQQQMLQHMRWDFLEYAHYPEGPPGTFFGIVPEFSQYAK